MASTILMAAAAIVAGPDQSEMIRVADAFDRAQLTQDRAALESLVDDGLLFIESSGNRSGKKQFIDGWTSAGDRYDPIVLVDRTITALDKNAFVVSAETTLSGTSGGKSFRSHFRFSDTFRRRGGRWQAIHIQVTRIGN